MVHQSTINFIVIAYFVIFLISASGIRFSIVKNQQSDFDFFVVHNQKDKVHIEKVSQFSRSFDSVELYIALNKSDVPTLIHFKSMQELQNKMESYLKKMKK